MTGFLAVFRAELRDLLYHPLVWLGAIATATAAFLLGTYAPFKDNGWVVYESALQAAAQAASFFLLGVAANSVAAERTRGTVRWSLPRPLGRAGFVLGKAAALSVIALALLGIGVTVATFVAGPHGFGDVAAEAPVEDPDDEGFGYVEDEVVPEVYQAQTMRRRATQATLLLIPALLSATGIGLLVSSLFRSAAAAVIVALGTAIPLYWLPEVIGLSPASARALPFRAANDFFMQLQGFGRRLSTADWPEYGGMGWAGALIAVFGLPLLAALLFVRQDITD